MNQAAGSTLDKEVFHAGSPYVFSNGKTARNRIVVPAMASQTSTATGLATAETLAHYERLARSGAGLVFAEYTFVHLSGRAEPLQLGLVSDEHERAVAPIAAALHQWGALAGFQLAHGGGKTHTSLIDGSLQSPSGVVVPVKGRDLETPQAMTLADIAAWKEWFVTAALRASRAGFDVAELHAAHGYGLNQWLSPVTNQRTDAYGGTAENRTRLLLEIVALLWVVPFSRGRLSPTLMLIHPHHKI